MSHLGNITQFHLLFISVGNSLVQAAIICCLDSFFSQPTSLLCSLLDLFHSTHSLEWFFYNVSHMASFLHSKTFSSSHVTLNKSCKSCNTLYDRPLFLSLPRVLPPFQLFTRLQKPLPPCSAFSDKHACAPRLRSRPFRKSRTLSPDSCIFLPCSIQVSIQFFTSSEIPSMITPSKITIPLPHHSLFLYTALSFPIARITAWKSKYLFAYFSSFSHTRL